jgi:hypothetical protein
MEVVTKKILKEVEVVEYLSGEKKYTLSPMNKVSRGNTLVILIMEVLSP